MLYKVEGRKPWARYEEIFMDGQKAADKAWKLESEGWEVEIIPLGGFTLDQYAAMVVADCFDKLDAMYGPDDRTSH